MATSMATNIVADGFTSKSRLKNAKVCREMFSQCFICHVVLNSIALYFLASNTRLILGFSFDFLGQRPAEMRSI